MAMLDRKAIYKRFIECYPTETPYELAADFEINPALPYQWKEGKTPVPWYRLKKLVNEQGISWDWLLEGKGDKHHLNEKKDTGRKFNRRAINKRFLSLYPKLSQGKLAKELGVSQVSVYRWCHYLAQIPWERLKDAVDNFEVTWEWLIEGRVNAEKTAGENLPQSE